MLRTKNQVLTLLQEIHETEEQIVKICFLDDRAEIITQLSLLGIDVWILEDANPTEITMKGNFDPKRVFFTIGEDPFTISKTIVLALSGMYSLPLYLNLNSKIIVYQNIQRNQSNQRPTLLKSNCEVVM
jgi:hypothetical protein